MPTALTPAFSADATKATQWRAFMTRGRLAPADLTLADAVDFIARFLWPPLEAARNGREFAAAWAAKGPAWKR
jgi:hypothetical protein